MTPQTALSKPESGTCRASRRRHLRIEADPNQVLIEQLAYLIRFSDQERERLDRVAAVLMEVFA